MLETLLSIFNPESIINYGGLLIIFLMVYGQTGLFFAFFLPSGALLFTSGVWSATGALHYSILTVCTTLIIAAMLGNITGYWFGRKTGPLLLKKKDSAFFKQEHLKTANSFYEKHGGVALAAGLFFPIIRTFSPIVAGVIKVDFRRFLLFTFAGSVLWISSFVFAGYLVGINPLLKPYLKYVIVFILVFVTVPVVIRIIRQFNKAKRENERKN